MIIRNRLVLVFAVLAIALGIYLLFIKDSGKSSDTGEIVELEDEGGSTGFRGNPANATFTFDDGPITLENGRAEIDIIEGSALKEEITLTGQVAYGDIDVDGKSDAAVIIVRSGGGSGSFVYVAALVSGAVNYTGTNAILLGDRIMPEEISVSNGIITVEYLDRGEDEPLAAEPTIARAKRFAYRSGELEEI